MIDLQQFCANTHDPRDYLREPFQLGACVYATNGHIAVRIPRDEAPHVKPNDRAPKHIEVLFGTAHDGGIGEFIPMPELPIDRVCSECQGKGTQDYGDGDEKCWQCNGLGFQTVQQDINDAAFNVHYLHMLAALPNARIRTNGESVMAAVLFDGGQALLMPVRK